MIFSFILGWLGKVTVQPLGWLAGWAGWLAGLAGWAGLVNWT